MSKFKYKLCFGTIQGVGVDIFYESEKVLNHNDIINFIDKREWICGEGDSTNFSCVKTCEIACFSMDVLLPDNISADQSGYSLADLFKKDED